MEDLKLFDIIKIMFTDTAKYKKIPVRVKDANFFMINRIFSIMYPTIAHSFNSVKIEGARVVDCWQVVARRFNKIPHWVFTKTKKDKQELNDKVKKEHKEFNYKTYHPSDEILMKFLNKYAYAKKDYEYALLINEEETKKLVFEFEKRLMSV